MKNISVKGSIFLVIILFFLGLIGVAANTLYDYASQKNIIEKNIQEKVDSILDKQKAIILPIK